MRNTFFVVTLNTLEHDLVGFVEDSTILYLNVHNLFSTACGSLVNLAACGQNERCVLGNNGSSLTLVNGELVETHSLDLTIAHRTEHLVEDKVWIAANGYGIIVRGVKQAGDCFIGKSCGKSCAINMNAIPIATLAGRRRLRTYIQSGTIAILRICYSNFCHNK